MSTLTEHYEKTQSVLTIVKHRTKDLKYKLVKPRHKCSFEYLAYAWPSRGPFDARVYGHYTVDSVLLSFGDYEVIK